MCVCVCVCDGSAVGVAHGLVFLGGRGVCVSECDRSAVGVAAVFCNFLHLKIKAEFGIHVRL